jgi:tRNA (guanine37-N1)-methyltransferase
MALKKITYLSLFPEMIDQGLSHSLVGKARAAGEVVLDFVQIRNFAKDKHRSVDDTCYGGGAGMLLRADVLNDAWLSATSTKDASLPSGTRPFTVLLSPQGRCLTQELAKDWVSSHEHIVFVCGHYEGVDERFIEACVDQELSIGDYILTGGEFAAVVASDVLIRLIPGVVGNSESVSGDSLEDGLLKAPQYTRPAEFQGKKVPEILLSGNHAKIQAWRKEQSIDRTRKKRPDLYQKYLEKGVAAK